MHGCVYSIVYHIQRASAITGPDRPLNPNGDGLNANDLGRFAGLSKNVGLVEMLMNTNRSSETPAG
jgi:hypothetical protein